MFRWLREARRGNCWKHHMRQVCPIETIMAEYSPKNILIYSMIQLMEVDQTDPGKCPNINIKPTVRKTFRDPSTGWLIYMRKEKELLAICRQVTKFRYLVKCLSSHWRPFSSIWLNGGFNEEESRNVQEMVMMSQTVTSPVRWKYPC